jgi:galactitol-specific phosphotransferase system IIB component
MRALAVIALALITAPALAASPQVEAAVKVFQAVAADANKVKIFCEMTKIDETMGGKADPALEAQIDKLLDQLGADFKIAWTAVEAIDEKSPDGTVLHAALDQLEDKCPK